LVERKGGVSSRRTVTLKNLTVFIESGESIVSNFMKLAELKEQLGLEPAAHIRFVLPDGSSVPAHAHVTEVARIDKRFVDCGGTLRNDSFCRLQTWFADDVQHRLTAGKLVAILDKAAALLILDDLEVDVEHEAGYISQFPLEAVAVAPDEIGFLLGIRHTACLAMDKCLPPSKPAPDFSPLKFNFQEPRASAGCCSTKPEPK
jgi:hypothetical protein